MSDVYLTRLTPGDAAGLLEVLGLAKAHASTLGFMPDSAFGERVESGNLVIARDGEILLGYCLFDLPRTGYIKLVHVCVADEARGRGVGKKLIEYVIALNPSATGVLAYCRRDYGLEAFWESAGLAPRNERPGRAIKGSVLSAWWRQLGPLDLLEDAALRSGLPLVVLDTNIVSDLYASPEVTRPDRSATDGLNAGWLQAAVTVAVSPRVDMELGAIEPADERAAQRHRSQHLLRLRGDQGKFDELVACLRSRAGAALLESDSSLVDDLLHLAHAVEAGAEFFVTNDGNLIAVSSSVLLGKHGLRVVRPHELIDEMMRRLDRPAYQAKFIAAGDLAWFPAAQVEEHIDQEFVTHQVSERLGDFRRRLRTAMAAHPDATRVLVDGKSKVWALVSQRVQGDALIVELLRVRRGDLAATVALQVARMLRREARDLGVSTVRVTDPAMAPVVLRALASDHFESESGVYEATVVREALSLVDAEKRLAMTLRTPAAVRHAESRYWPLVIKGADVPTYLVPIWPNYAEQLFGIERSTLWATERKRALGLAREHVYFSAATSAFPTRESRILWYVTADRSGVERRIMARSRCVFTERASVEEAHARHGHIGVLRKGEVEDAGRDGYVSVVRFEDTEVLPRPVGGADLKVILTKHAVRGNILSFRAVPAAVFDDIVEMQDRSAT